MLYHRLLLTCLGLLAMLACGTSQKAQAGPEVPSADSTQLENALLWRISHPDIAHESYLYGTIHLIDAEDYFKPAGLDRVMDYADRFVFEIDMADMTDLGAQMSILTKAFMSDGVRLRDLISKEDYALVSEHFEEMGLPMFMLERIKPLFLTVFASEDMDPNSLSSGEMKSYEMEFYDYAQQNEKTTGGLETIEYQLSVFDSIPYADQAEMLVESLRATEEQNDVFEDMIDLYKTQDIEGLYMAVGSEEMGAGAYEDILVTNRNAQWIDRIGEYMKSDRVLFAVGAGHLGGPNGVVRLLRKAGYTVTPVLQMEDTGRENKKF